jgi:GDP-mannose 6-dehydrogenase
MKISVFGLGYVGAVSLGCLARDGHELIGVDLDPVKLGLIGEGKSPIVEKGMDELIRGGVASGRIRVTQDAFAAVQGSEVTFLCVGTPAQANGSQNLSAIRRVCEQMGAALRSKAGYHLVVLRSTVLPGTLDSVVTPLLESGSEKRSGRDFDACFQPEFLREGSSIDDYDNPPFTVIGAESERAQALMRQLFGHLPGEFIVTAPRTAEMLKYACNLFHAVKITFANEIGRLSKALGVDPHAVMRAVCLDRQLNISPAYLKPGFAFGGSCLPKDLNAILHAGKTVDALTPMLSGVIPSNQCHIERAIGSVLDTGKKRVGLLGLSFKAGTDDLRESPLVTLAERFIGKGLSLRIYDPAVNLARLIGANRHFIEETIPHIAALMTDSCEALVQQSDVLVVGQFNDHIRHILERHLRDDHVILDLVHIPKRDGLRGAYQGICW